MDIYWKIVGIVAILFVINWMVSIILKHSKGKGSDTYQLSVTSLGGLLILTGLLAVIGALLNLFV